jgi:hypothetical protein
MNHNHADAGAECAGRLRFLGSYADSRMGRAGRVEVNVARYRCLECGETLALRRRMRDAPEGLVPVVELAFELG